MKYAAQDRELDIVIHADGGRDKGRWVLNENGEVEDRFKRQFFNSYGNLVDLASEPEVEVIHIMDTDDEDCEYMDMHERRNCAQLRKGAPLFDDSHGHKIKETQRTRDTWYPRTARSPRVSTTRTPGGTNSENAIKHHHPKAIKNPRCRIWNPDQKVSAHSNNYRGKLWYRDTAPTSEDASDDEDQYAFTAKTDSNMENNNNILLADHMSTLAERLRAPNIDHDKVHISDVTRTPPGSPVGDTAYMSMETDLFMPADDELELTKEFNENDAKRIFQNIETMMVTKVDISPEDAYKLFTDLNIQYKRNPPHVVLPVKALQLFPPLSRYIDIHFELDTERCTAAQLHFLQTGTAPTEDTSPMPTPEPSDEDTIQLTAPPTPTFDYGYDIDDTFTLFSYNPGPNKFKDAQKDPQWGCAVEKALNLRLTFAVWMNVVMHCRFVIDDVIATLKREKRDLINDDRDYIRWRLDYIFNDYLNVKNGILEQNECNVLLSIHRLLPTNMTHPNRPDWPHYLMGHAQYIPNHCTQCHSVTHTDSTCPHTQPEATGDPTTQMDIDGYEHLLEDTATDEDVHATVLDVLGDDDGWLNTIMYDPNTVTDEWDDPTQPTSVNVKPSKLDVFQLITMVLI